MKTKLERISQLSGKNPDMVFTSVGHLINKNLLKQCHNEMDGAVGIVGVIKEGYRENLDGNFDKLLMMLNTKLFHNIQK